MIKQIGTNSFRARGPLVMYGTQSIDDVFASGRKSDSNRVPYGPHTNADRVPAFPNVLRSELYKTLWQRVINPGAIHQRGSSLCGPASLLYLTGTYFPSKYSNYIIDLYEYGQAMLGSLSVEPGEDCRIYNPAGKIAEADWVGLASLRDSENAIFDYDEVEDAFAGITLPMTLARWLGCVGFCDIKNETNIYFTKDEDNLREADRLFREGHKVCLLVDYKGIEAIPERRGFISQIFTIPNHWVVLTSPVDFSNGNVKFQIFTWGNDEHKVPPPGPNSYPLDLFLKFYYGYVSCF
jgi:hypothetical protein